MIYHIMGHFFKLNFRGTPHPSTGHTVVPTALKTQRKDDNFNITGQSPTLKDDGATSSTPQVGIQFGKGMRN